MELALTTKLGILFAGMIVGFMGGILFMLICISLSMRDYWRGGK